MKTKEKSSKANETGAIIKSISACLSAHPEIIAAYLFGSTATGRTHRQSDIDIGILLKTRYKQSPLYSSRLARSISKILPSKNEPDVRVLNNASPRFLFQVIKNGKLIISKNEKKRVQFETGVISQYLDIKPFYEEYDRIRSERLCA